MRIHFTGSVDAYRDGRPLRTANPQRYRLHMPREDLPGIQMIRNAMSCLHRFMDAAGLRADSDQRYTAMVKLDDTTQNRAQSK